MKLRRHPMRAGRLGSDTDVAGAYRWNYRITNGKIIWMRDYGGDIPCPECGQKHHISPRQLQGDLQIEFTCARCGADVIADNDVAGAIVKKMDLIKRGLGKIKV